MQDTDEKIQGQGISGTEGRGRMGGRLAAERPPEAEKMDPPLVRAVRVRHVTALAQAAGPDTQVDDAYRRAARVGR